MKKHIQIIIVLTILHLQVYAQPIASGYATSSTPTIAEDLDWANIATNRSGAFNISCSASYMRCIERSFLSINTPNYSAPQVVYNNTASGKPDRYPRSAVATNGSYMVVYVEENSTIITPTNFSIYLQKYNANGSPNGTRVFIDFGLFPSIDIAADGTYNIAYQSGHYYINPSVYVKRYNASYTQVGSRITVSGALSAQNRSVRIRSKNSNSFYVMYYAGLSSSAISFYGTNGALQSTISYASDHLDQNEFIVKPGNEIILLHAINTTNFVRGYYRSIYPAGATTPSVSTLITSVPSSTHIWWSIEMNYQGNYVICMPVYPNNSSAALQVVQEYDLNNNPVGSPQPILDDVVRNSYIMTNNDVAVSDCKYMVMWREIDPTNFFCRIAYKIYNLKKASIANAGIDKLITNCCATCSTTTIGTPSVSGYTYQWSPTTYMTPTNGQTSTPTITHPGTGASYSIDYTVTATNPFGCTATDIARVSFAACRAGETGDLDISISPNPVHDKLKIEFANIDTKSTDLTIYDLSGKKILNHNSKDLISGIINTEALQPGIYFLEISSEGQSMKIIKFVKE